MGDEKKITKKYFEETKAKAEKGNKIAQFYLGMMYDNGEGVLEDDKEALKWFRKAAEKGHVKAQYNLGVRYAKGEGVPLDDAPALAWLNIAAANGHETAKKIKGIIAKKMTADVISKAEALSKEMLKKNPKLIKKP